MADLVYQKTYFRGLIVIQDQYSSSSMWIYTLQSYGSVRIFSQETMIVYAMQAQTNKVKLQPYKIGIAYSMFFFSYFYLYNSMSKIQRVFDKHFIEQCYVLVCAHTTTRGICSQNINNTCRTLHLCTNIYVYVCV